MNNKGKNIDAGDVVIESLDKPEANSKHNKGDVTSNENDNELSDKNSTIKKIIKG